MQTEPNTLIGDSDDEVRNAITAFERILDVMPNDRASLEAVYNACTEIGDTDLAREYFVRLVNAMVDEGDDAAAAELLTKSPRFADDSRLREVVDRLHVGGASGTPSGAESASSADPRDTPVIVSAARLAGRQVDSTFNMPAELALAWNLLEAGDLTQEEYSGVVQDLTELSVGDSAETVSVLHVLEARSHRHLHRAIARIAEECGTPFVALSCFDLQAASEMLLPMDFMLRRGAIVFEHIGNHALVAILNPLDGRLRDDVRAITGSACHFYVTAPAEFDAALTRLSDVQAVKAAGKAE